MIVYCNYRQSMFAAALYARENALIPGRSSSEDIIEPFGVGVNPMWIEKGGYDPTRYC